MTEHVNIDQGTAGAAIVEAGHLIAMAGETIAEAAASEGADEGPLGGDATGFEPSWAKDAPRGGRVVLGRMLREQAKVPLFLAQAFVQSLRDVGYDSTTSALCEHVDNAIGAGAANVRVLFRQTGKRGGYGADVAVADDGRGMSNSVLKAATAFGGSMSFGDRHGIGRYGMGMKTAGLSMAKAMDIVSWQERGAYYRMTLDTVAIGRDQSNMVVLDDPEYLGTLPSDLATMLTIPMSFPKDASEQTLPVPRDVEVVDALGRHGTIVYMPDCDRLSNRMTRTLVEDATKTFAHVYRREIAKGLKIWVNNRLVEMADPTLSSPESRHARLPALAEVKERTSRVVFAEDVAVETFPGSGVHRMVKVRIFALPIREWSKLPRKSLNEIGVFNDQIVSILRNGREVYLGRNAKIVSKHNTANWLRVEIDFDGDLDEAFGIAANKQGVRPKEHVYESIRKRIAAELSSILKDIETVQAENSLQRTSAGPSAAERKAQEADAFQADRLDTTMTEAERAQMDENLRGLAVGLKRENETEEQAFDRIKQSNYVITYKSDRYWPFFTAESRFGKVILTINTAHPFYARLYEPLFRLAAATEGGDPGEAGDGPVTVTRKEGTELVTMLDFLLLSMARTQTIMGHGDGDVSDVFDNFRRGWSDALKTQMNRV